MLPKHTGADGTHLCDRLLIPHSRFIDKTVDFYIPISTRNDHPGPPETHRHFHFSSAALIPKRKKPLQSDNNHPRGAKVEKVNPQLLRSDRSEVVFVSLRPRRRKEKPSIGSSGGAGWRPPVPCWLTYRNFPTKRFSRERERTTGLTVRARPHVRAGTKNVSNTTQHIAGGVAEGEPIRFTRLFYLISNTCVTLGFMTVKIRDICAWCNWKPYQIKSFRVYFCCSQER